MSDDWLKDRAKQIRDKESASEKRRDWEIHKSQALHRKGPVLWESMIVQLLEYAAQFNQEIGNPNRQISRIERTPAGAILARSVRPGVEIQAEYLEDTQRVRIAITQTLPNLPPCAKPVHIEMDLTDEGQLVFVSHNRRMNHREMAQSLMEEFFEGLD